jgi:hypothetical protein
MRSLDPPGAALLSAALLLANTIPVPGGPPVAGPVPTAAQQPDTADAPAPAADTVDVDSLLIRIDRLEETLRELRARLDSLAGDAAAAEEDDGEDGDELAELRKAARRAAEEAREADGDTAGDGRSRTRSLQDLNPEISVTGDFVGSWASPGGPEGADATAVPRGFEVSMQAALDPSTRAKAFVVREEEPPIAGLGEDEDGEGEEGGHGGEVEVEEAYMYWVGLPGGLGARLGKFRQEFGLYNRWHDHALHEVDRPLPYREFLGGALIQAGAGVTAPSLGLGPSTTTLDVEVTRGSNERLFAGGNELTGSARLKSFFDLGPSSFVQVGASGVWGENDDEGLRSKVLGLDAYYRWTPAGRGLYRDLQLRAEWFLADRDRGDADLDGHGGYLQAAYRLDRQWVLGARAGWVDRLGDRTDVAQFVPSLTYWQSEWVRMRLQYNLVRPEAGANSHSLLFQVVWALGPHKHEEY